MMKTVLQNIFFTAIALLFSTSLWGQNNIVVESFYMNEKDQAAQLDQVTVHQADRQVVRL
jgi:hypothetical protein